MIYKIADKVRQDLNGKIDIASIRQYVEKLGYSIVFFNTEKGNAEIVAQHLEEEAAKRKAFTYERNAKFIFIDNNLTDESKLHLLLHELGHVLMHMNALKTDIDPISAEQQAEAFAYEVKSGEHENYKVRNNILVLSISVGLTVIICFLTIFLFLEKRNNSSVFQKETYSLENTSSASIASTSVNETEDVFYVLPTGTKYHKKNCKYVTKKAMAIDVETAESNYEACKVCRP